jgi:hypothetical protein
MSIHWNVRGLRKSRPKPERKQWSSVQEHQQVFRNQTHREAFEASAAGAIPQIRAKKEGEACY